MFARHLPLLHSLSSSRLIGYNYLYYGRYFCTEISKNIKENNNKQDTLDTIEFKHNSKPDVFFEPIKSMLTTKRWEKAVKQGCDIPLDIPYKLKSSSTWVSFDPTLNIGINNKTNPTMRLTFEDPTTGKLRRIKYETNIYSKGFMIEGGIRIGTTYAAPPYFQEPIVYSSLPQVLTISSGLTTSIGFAQIEVFSVNEYPDYTFTSISAGFSFGFGFAFIQEGQIDFNHKNTIFEKIREKTNLVKITTKLSPIIHFFWLIAFFTITSSPVIVLLFD